MGTYAIWVIIAVCVIGLLLTIAAGRREKRERDANANATTVKHPVLSNPIFISYIVFPVLILIGIAYILLNS